MDESRLRSMFSELFQPFREFMDKFKGTGVTGVAGIAAPAPTDPPAVGSAAFNEAVRSAAKGLVDEATAEFSGRIETLETENAGLKKQLAEASKSGTKAAVDALIEHAAGEGRWIPAFNEDGTREMVYAMAAQQPIEFGEAGADGKRKSLDGIGQVKAYLAKLPQQVQFGELTAGAGDNRSMAKVLRFNAPTDGKTGVVNADLAMRAEQIFNEGKGQVEYTEALRQARGELRAG